jgi:hypothetical protein
VRAPPFTQIPSRAKVPDQESADTLMSSSLSPLAVLAERLRHQRRPMAPSSNVTLPGWDAFE